MYTTHYQVISDTILSSQLTALTIKLIISNQKNYNKIPIWH